MVNNDLFKKLERKLDSSSLKFKIKENLRLKRKNFYLVNIQWGNTISVNNDIFKFIESNQKKFKFEEIPLKKSEAIFLILKILFRTKI